MATITQSIGTAGREHSTMTLWEADLDNDTPYDAGDDAVGEMYNDSVFDETVSINGGGTLGLNSVTLTVASAERHDGTAGTGVRVVATTGRNIGIATPNGFNEKYNVRWIEFDQNGNAGPCILGNSQDAADVGSVENMLVHDQAGGSSGSGFVFANGRDLRVQNSIFYDNSRSATGLIRGLYLDSDRPGGGCLNNTVFKVVNPGSGTVAGIFIQTDDATDGRVKNNISMGHTAGGTVQDFNFPGTGLDSLNNMSEDATADDGGGSGHLISKTLADQFVSTTNGSEDLHLKSGSDAIDAGVDLGTTPTGVELDIDNRNRATEADTWDIGADEFVAAGGGGGGSPMLYFDHFNGGILAHG